MMPAFSRNRNRSGAPPTGEYECVSGGDVFIRRYPDHVRKSTEATRQGGQVGVEEFKYTKLSDMNKKIRLLSLNPGKLNPDEDVVCELFEVEIREGKVWRTPDEPAPYEALSWSWGTAPAEDSIYIFGNSVRRRMSAKPDLVSALRHLRYENRSRILWIDAICIDQKSVDEKNHQVQMMSQIYSYAERVCIWLGDADEESKMAIGFIKEGILQLENFDTLCADDRNSRKWQSLLMLMQREWFFRRWVVQEIALARDAVIYCGANDISWKDFSVAVELFVEVEEATHRLSDVMKKDPRFYHVPGWFEHVSALGASLLVEATGMVFRYYKTLPRPGRMTTSNTQLPATTPASTAPEKASTPPATFPTTSPLNDSDSDFSVDSDDDDDHALTEAHAPRRGEESDGEQNVPPQPDDQSDQDDSGGDQAKKRDDSNDPISQRRPLLSLEYLVSRLSIFKATEPRDAIYALLAIASDGYPAADGPDDYASQDIQKALSRVGSQQPFPVDYGRPYTDVCRDFIDFCIKRADNPSRAVDIICRPWAPKPRKSAIAVRFAPKEHPPEMVKWHKTLKEFFEVRPGVDSDKLPWIEPPPPPPPPKKNESQPPEQTDANVKEPTDPKSGDGKKTPPQPPVGRRHGPLWEDLSKFFPSRSKQSKNRKLPSWIPNLDGAPFAMYPHAGIHILKLGRRNADPLVGLPRASHNYDATQGAKVNEKVLRFQKRRGANQYCMTINGFILDTVDKVAAASQLGGIPKEWLKLGKWKIRDNAMLDNGPPEEFWRTLVGDRGKDGRNPPYYYSRACKESVYKGGLASGSVNTSDLINNERNSIVAQFCRRVQSVIWDRCLIRTKGETGVEGYLGIANKKVKKGDLVCILYGCSVPVILRRKVKTDEKVDEERKEDELEKMVMRIHRAMVRLRNKRRREKRYKSLTEEEKKKVKEALAEYKKYCAERAIKNPNKKEGTTNGNTMVQPDISDRPHQDAKHYYKFIGECYIHGMMDGEAMRRKSKADESFKRRWGAKQTSRGSRSQGKGHGRGQDNNNTEEQEGTTTPTEEIPSGLDPERGDDLSGETVEQSPQIPPETAKGKEPEHPQLVVDTASEIEDQGESSIGLLSVNPKPAARESSVSSKVTEAGSSSRKLFARVSERGSAMIQSGKKVGRKIARSSSPPSEGTHDKDARKNEAQPFSSKAPQSSSGSESGPASGDPENLAPVESNTDKMQPFDHPRSAAETVPSPQGLNTSNDIRESRPQSNLSDGSSPDASHGGNTPLSDNGTDSDGRQPESKTELSAEDTQSMVEETVSVGDETPSVGQETAEERKEREEAELQEEWNNFRGEMLRDTIFDIR